MNYYKENSSKQDNIGATAKAPCFLPTQSDTPFESAEQYGDWIENYLPLGNGTFLNGSWQPNQEENTQYEIWSASRSHQPVLPSGQQAANSFNDMANTISGPGYNEPTTIFPSHLAHTGGSIWDSFPSDRFKIDNEPNPLVFRECHRESLIAGQPPICTLPIPLEDISFTAFAESSKGEHQNFEKVNGPSAFATNTSPVNHVYEYALHMPSSKIPWNRKIEPLSSDLDEKFSPPCKNLTHNVIERRYRNNINARITELKSIVPALRHARVKKSQRLKRPTYPPGNESINDNAEYLDGVAVATKLNKATILCKATEYIGHLKTQNEHTRKENLHLIYCIAQLPGGQQLVERYFTHRAQQGNEKVQERPLPQQKRAIRKRHRTASSRSSLSEKSTLPDTTANRIFMVAFMSLCLFSSSPFGASPSSSEQFGRHSHVSQSSSLGYNPLTASVNSYREPSWASSLALLFFSLSPLKDFWTTLQTALFIVGILQIIWPLFTLLRSCVNIRLQKVRHLRGKTLRRRHAPRALSITISPDEVGVTPGNRRCMQIYDTPFNSLERDNKVPPRGVITTLVNQSKELLRSSLHHCINFGILAQDLAMTPHDDKICMYKRIKLNEVDCLGGNPIGSNHSTLHSYIKIQNLVQAFEDDEYSSISQIHSRVYNTTDMKIDFFFSKLLPMEKCLRHRALNDLRTEDNCPLQVLLLNCLQDNQKNCIAAIRSSAALRGTLLTVQQQIFCHNYLKAPVLNPVTILSAIYLVDNWQTLFDWLFISVKSESKAFSPEFKGETSFNETVFGKIPSVASTKNIVECSDHDSCRYIAHWLATVGAIVEELWNDDAIFVKDWLRTLVLTVPRALFTRATEKSPMYHTDKLAKKRLVHILLGAAFPKTQYDAVKNQYYSLQELYAAEENLYEIKQLIKHRDPSPRNFECLSKHPPDLLSPLRFSKPGLLPGNL